MRYIIGLLAILTTSSFGKGTLTFSLCNWIYNGNLKVAIAVFGQEEWTTKGWKYVPFKDCKDFTINEHANGVAVAYIHAEAPDRTTHYPARELSKHDSEMCVSEGKSFSIGNSEDDCDTGQYKATFFQQRVTNAKVFYFER